MAPKDVDHYIATFPNNVQTILRKLRTTIRKAAPGARETINYGIPAFSLEGSLVHYAAFKKHIGLYPRRSAINKFKAELSGYEMAKGTVRFPIGEPVPLDLISKIVKFRVKENRASAKAKSESRSGARA